MSRPFLVFEDVASTSRHRLFALLGVEWVATRYAWIEPLFFTSLGLFGSAIARSASPPSGRLIQGLGWGLFLYLCNAVHSLGHIIFGRAVGAPMNANLLTATRDVSLYEDDRRTVSDHVRAVRAMGGPAANLALGALVLGLAHSLGSDWLSMCGYLSLGVAAWTLMPVPTLDGWILWKAVLARFGQGQDVRNP